MILPETSTERDFTYAVAAMTIRARAQDDAGDTEGAIVLSQARRNLISRGTSLNGARNDGLIEFATTLAAQDEKPAAFVTFLAAQDKVLADAREAKREQAAEPAPEPETPKPAPRRRRTKKED